MRYWIFKSEPRKYSWDQLVLDGCTHWNGVRNAQAAKNMRAMRLGDRGFFYHSNEGLNIVGVVEVVRENYPDPSDASNRFCMVDIRPLLALAQPVSLRQMKTDPRLVDLALIRQSRLSVSSVSEFEWRQICRLGGVAV